MKTSKILLAMALPVAFAACSSEEIVENNNVSLQNRELLPAMAAVVESGVDSRFSWNEEKFGWNKFTAEDNFAAGLTDANLWEVGNLMMTNYIFNDEAGNGSYTTTSQMVEGTYFFYSYPGFENVAARQGVPFDLTSQKSVDFKKPAAAVEENQLFVSALYKLDKATANEALPIKFVSYWSTAGMKIKNTTGDDMKIVRMMITTDEKMELKGIVAPVNLGGAAKKNSDVCGLVYYNNGTSYVLPTYYADKETKVEWDDIKTIDMADSSVEGGLEENTMMLTVENGELADDEEATVYFQMPADVYGSVTVTFFVEVPTADGETEVKELEAVAFAKNLDTDEDGEADKTAFYRGGTTSAFGVLAGELATHKITELDVLSATESGAYAASYEDLVDIIKAGNETVISNMGDLKIDDAVIALFKSTTANNNLGAGEYYVFNNPIEITTEKAAAQTLKNIQVKNATIAKGKFNVAYDLVADPKGVVTVGEGAEFTISTSQSGTIENIGTVNVVNAETTDETAVKVVIVDGSTTENKAETTVKLALAGKKTYVSSEAVTTKHNNIIMETLPSNLKFEAPMKGDKAVAATYLTKATIAYGKKLYVGENVTVNNHASDYAIVNGYVENKGTIEKIKINGSYANSTVYGASIDNYGVIENAIIGAEVASATEAVKNAVKKAVTITNEVETAKINAATIATGTVVLEGRIDNKAGGFVTATGVEVFAEITENTTGKINISDINTLYVTDMTWTDGAVSSNITTLYLDDVTLAHAGTGSYTFEPASTSVYMSGVTANSNVAVDVTAATVKAEIESSTFNGALKYNGTDLVGVTVKGKFTTAPTAAMNWTDVTLNLVEVSGTPNLNVKGQANKNASGTITSYTVKTTTLNDVISGSFGAVVVENDAVLTIKNDVVLKATSITVNGSDSAIETSKKGVLNVYGSTGSSTVTNNGGTIN